jgi:tRNA(Ile)-lysidine synthase
VPLVFVGGDLLFVPFLGVNREATAKRGTLYSVASRYFRIDWRPDLLIA